MTTAGRAGDVERVEALVALLSDHPYLGPYYGCRCMNLVPDESNSRFLPWHRAHLAQQIAALVAEWVAEGQRDLEPPPELFSEFETVRIREWLAELGGAE